MNFALLPARPPTVCLTAIFGKMGRKSLNHVQAFKSNPVQALSVTLKVLGNRKSVTVSDVTLSDYFHYTKVLFGSKNCHSSQIVTQIGVTVTDKPAEPSIDQNEKGGNIPINLVNHSLLILKFALRYEVRHTSRPRARTGNTD